MFMRNLTIAWRSLWRTPATTLLNIAGLAAGMAAAVLILLWVQNEWRYDQSGPNAASVYRLGTRLTDNSWKWEGTPLLLADAVKKEVPEAVQVARLYTDRSPVFTIKGNPLYEKQCAYVDAAWFGMFGYSFITGSAAAFESDMYSVILTESAARKYFGSREAVGERVMIDNHGYQVKAVVADAPASSSFQYQAFIPIAALLTDKQLRENDENWDNGNYRTFIQLKPGAPIAAVTQKLTSVLQQYAHDNAGQSAVSLTALKDMHFETDLQDTVFVHGNRQTVYIFSLLAVLLLLTACINYVNLTTARSSLHAREVSIRKIAGAGRVQLLYRFMAESVLVSLLSLLAALALVYVCLPAFNAVTGKNFTLPLTLPALWQVLGGTLFTAVVLNSVYPAVLLSSFKPLNVLKGVTLLKLKDVYFRKALMVVQFTIAVTLIAGTIIIYRQMRFIQEQNPGYDRSQVLSFWMPQNLSLDAGKKAALMQTVKQALLAESSMQNITLANQPIVQVGSATTGADWEGHDTSFKPKLAQVAADADFANTLHLQMQQGRWFQNGNLSDKDHFILNETAVRELGIAAPVLGRRFSLHGHNGVIIGVVKDFHYKSMHEKTGALVVFNDPAWQQCFMVRIAPHRNAEALQALQAVWKQYLPGYPVEYHFLDDQFAHLYQADQQALSLITVFSLVAAGIAGLGLFSLAAFAIAQRTKEIGIRKVLGAKMLRLTLLLSKEFIQLTGIAIVLAGALSWWVMNRWLRNFAYHITIHWWMLAIAALSGLCITFITVGVHAVRAAGANPSKSLRAQ